MVRTKWSRTWAALAIALVLATTALPAAALERPNRPADRTWLGLVELLDVVWTWLVGGDDDGNDVLYLDLVPMKSGGTCEGTNPPMPPHPQYGCEVDPAG